MKTIFSGNKKRLSERRYVCVLERYGRLEYYTMGSRNERDNYESLFKDPDRSEKLLYRITVMPGPKLQSKRITREMLNKTLTETDRGKSVDV